MVNFLYRHKCIFRVAVLSLCFVVAFCMFPPADAYAVATEVALTYLIWGLFTAAGVTATSLAVVQHQTIDSDLRAGGNAGTRLVDMSNRFYTGLPAVDKNRLLRMAGELAISETRALLNSADNNADIKALAPAVDDFVSTEFDIYSLDDWADAPERSYSIDKSYFQDDTFGPVTITQNRVNDVLFPTSTVSSLIPNASSNVFSDECEVLMSAISGSESWGLADVKPYVLSIFNAGYTSVNLSLFASLGVNAGFTITRSDGSYYSIASYGDLTLTSISGRLCNSGLRYLYFTIGVDSSGNLTIVTHSRNVTDSQSYTCNFTSTGTLSNFTRWAINSYQSGNPSYQVEGSGALSLEEPVLLTELITFPTPPDSGDPDDDDHDIPLLWFPPWPSRQTSEDPPEEVPVVDPDQIVWNDLVVFNQQQLADGYPDQQPDVDPDDPGGGGGDINIPSNGPIDIPLSPPDAFGFASIWHYVTDTFDYVADFFDSFAGVLAVIPLPVITLCWACVTLVIVFGVFRRLIE